MLDAFKSMQVSGVETNVISYNSLVIACAKGRKAEEALDVCKSMQAAGVEPNDISYNSLITACAEGGKAEELAIVAVHSCEKLSVSKCGTEAKRR